jgi:hypothetical protein
MSAISNPNELDTISAVILRRLEAATNRFASGDKRVNRLTLPGLTWLTDFAVLADFDAFTVLAVLAGLTAFWSRLAEIGVTEAGALGNPFVALFFAGPGRFKLLL